MGKRLGYLGWHGRGNFGDDLLHSSWKRALGPEITLFDLPLYRADFRSALGALGASAAGAETMLLGGGTVLGFRNWARHVTRCIQLLGMRRVVAVGCGAAAPGDELAARQQAIDWVAWRRLSSLEVRGVRGPLSVESLSRAGFSGLQVVGDPALLWTLHDDALVRDSLGVSVGNQEGSAFDHESIAEIVMASARRHGLRPRVFSLSPEDMSDNKRLAGRIPGAEFVAYEGDIDAVMEQIGRCRVMASERLHGCVAAATLDIPSISLAYLSKCVDFMKSIHRDDFVIETTTPVSHLTDLIEWSVTQSNAPSRRIVSSLREGLGQEARRVAALAA